MLEKQLNVFEMIVSILTSKEIIIAIFGGFIGAVISPWTKWHFRKKELIRQARKERIKSWRDRLNEFSTIKEFYTTPLYNELSEYVTVKEEDELLKRYDMVVGRVIDGEVVGEDVNKRFIARFHKAISDKEKEWGLI
jgi:hypothetical protein